MKPKTSAFQHRKYCFLPPVSVCKKDKCMLFLLRLDYKELKKNKIKIVKLESWATIICSELR